MFRNVGPSGVSDAAVNTELLNWARDQMESIQESTRVGKDKLHGSIFAS